MMIRILKIKREREYKSRKKEGGKWNEIKKLNIWKHSDDQKNKITIIMIYKYYVNDFFLGIELVSIE